MTVHGRAEICGNHTDHQNGRVIASVIGASLTINATPNNDGVIRIAEQNVSVAPDSQARPGTTAALIRGVTEYLGVSGGFDLDVCSDIPIGAGLSSSAAFEVALGRVLAPDVDALTLAKAGQYAETRWFGKPCGLMDQLICAVGGTAMLDFENPDSPLVTPLAFEPRELGLEFIIVNTGGSHAGLNSEYAAIPAEMRSVAEYFGKSVLREVDEREFRAELPQIRAACGDRAVLRAMHFFAENERVLTLSRAIEQHDSEEIIRIIRESGSSSAQYLQNIHTNVAVQPLGVALAVSERVLGSGGAARVHGGGFAGGILAVMRSGLSERYASAMEALFGEGCCRAV